MKSTRRSLLSFMGAAVFAAAMSFSAVPASVKAEDAVTLRMHQFLPEQANIPKHVLKKWIADVDKASGGSIKVELYSAMALGGKPPELYDQAVDGIADITWVVLGYTPGRFPEAEVFELPFMMTDAGPTSKALWQFAQKHLVNDEMSDVHPLAFWVHGPGLIHSKDPIRKVSDLKGVKLRAPTNTTNILFKNLGAEPIGMPVPAVPENLSKGVIDATVIPWEVTGALKVAELVHNHTVFPNASLYTTTFVLAMNKDRYESLSDSQRKAIDSVSGLEFSGFAGTTMQADDEPSHQIAVKLGNNIIELSPEEVAEWKEASKPSIQQWIDDMKKAGHDGQALIDEANALIKANSK